MTLLIESRLSAFTVMIRFITSSDVTCSDLWRKEARNTSPILRAWDGLSQFRTMIVKILEVVESIEPLESVDGMCVVRESSVKSKTILARSCKADREVEATPWFNRQGQAHIVSTARLRTWFSIDPQPASISPTINISIVFICAFPVDCGQIICHPPNQKRVTIGFCLIRQSSASPIACVLNQPNFPCTLHRNAKALFGCALE
jgi:hypothetical protein